MGTCANTIALKPERFLHFFEESTARERPARYPGPAVARGRRHDGSRTVQVVEAGEQQTKELES